MVVRNYTILDLVGYVGNFNSECDKNPLEVSEQVRDIFGFTCRVSLQLPNGRHNVEWQGWNQ